MKRRIVKALALVSASTMLFGMTALAAPKTMSDGGVFDATYYAQTYPDVAAAFGTDENLLYQHYLTCGKAEGRLPYAPGTAVTSAASNIKTMADGGKFDPTYYAQQNPDVVAALGTDENVLYQHYKTSGKNEGRLPYAGATVTPAGTYIGSAKGRNFYLKTSLPAVFTQKVWKYHSNFTVTNATILESSASYAKLVYGFDPSDSDYSMYVNCMIYDSTGALIGHDTLTLNYRKNTFAEIIKLPSQKGNYYIEIVK